MITGMLNLSQDNRLSTESHASSIEEHSPEYKIDIRAIYETQSNL